MDDALIIFFFYKQHYIIMKITKTDPFTDKENTLDLDITQEHLDKWKNGELIQNAMPHLTPSEREFLMTGTTAESWDKHIANTSNSKTLSTGLIRGLWSLLYTLILISFFGE